MLHFNVEWQEAPGVRDPLLKATWARLEIRASDGGGDVCLTECVSLRTKGLRSGVYGTVFPLAWWVVENWWSLLNEGRRFEGFRSGRDLGRFDEARPWVQRHNLLVGRGGSALPDLSIFRDGDLVVLGASPDPDDPASPYPVRFLSSRALRLDPRDVERGLQNFATTVLERIKESEGTLRDTSEAVELRENWNAVHSARGAERRLCETAAAMGVDPYDSDELSEDLAAAIEEDVTKLGDEVRGEFVAATRPEKLGVDLAWLRSAAGRVEPLPARIEDAATDWVPGDRPAHQAGYEAASLVRSRFGIVPDVVEDLGALMEEHAGWDPAPLVEPPPDGVASRFSGLAGRDERARYRIVAPGVRRSDEDARFLLGRGWFLTAGLMASSAALLSRSSSWVQQASRAFAAELLAPSAALRRRISGAMDPEQVEDLAREFKVRPEVVRRQIQNHDLAVLFDS